MKTDQAGGLSSQSEVVQHGRGGLAIPPSASLRRASLPFVLLAFILYPSSFILSATVEAVVKAVSGKVEWSRPGATKFEALKAGDRLGVGSTIRTGKDGVATVVTVPGAAVRIAADSELVLNELEFAKTGQTVTKRRAKLDLKSGTVSALIKNNEPEVTSFEVKTPHGVAAARGTFYGVSVDKEHSFVLCKEGKVGLQKKAEKE